MRVWGRNCREVRVTLRGGTPHVCSCTDSPPACLTVSDEAQRRDRAEVWARIRKGFTAPGRPRKDATVIA